MPHVYMTPVMITRLRALSFSAHLVGGGRRAEDEAGWQTIDDVVKFRVVRARDSLH